MSQWSLPWSFEPQAYRQWNEDLDGLEDDELVEHYTNQGKQEGRRPFRLTSRGEFAALIPATALALEIGPFASPVLRGPNVRYCDILDTEQLRRRAPEHGVDLANVPAVDYVMPGASLDAIPDQFDALLSSHAIEHQPDLVRHLQEVERRLRPGGRYFVLAPDHRYCFDRNLAPSTIAEVLQAHLEQRRVHTLRSVIEHRAYNTHNDPARHWTDPTPARLDSRQVDLRRVAAAMREHESAAGGYIDVHAWYFNPDSFGHLLELLRGLGLTRLQVERLYPTCRGSVEFWAVLALDPGPAGPWDAAAARPAADWAPPAASSPATPRAGLLGRTLRTLVTRR
ncbi:MULTISPECIES: class I SAM-dependent methyltransferase [Ramlibacter]|uniref:Methyltransferase domain-containing protein n=1 Tax=Ramlibacter pinisoli TaxID=2682844 RepID=A0A6N8J0Q5_9BURK|nr:MULTISPECIES: methyltransferase domain-containing protein [Ramlibacter]MBA2962926.1 methyltransferase domain-containing protein [Ramlibacter sp. CGMCC 1.13660]MVQ32869.1 methyltransferase domain-containing protein [Ramlibacter pinisoli]